MADFIAEIPKAELHLHLEGSIQPETLLELKRKRGAVEATLRDAEQLYRYRNFQGFLLAFK